MDPLIEAVNNQDLAALQRALQPQPKLARAVLTAAGQAWLPGLELLHQHGAPLNDLYRGYRPLHALLQEDAHQPITPPTPQRLACLHWLLDHGADPELPAAWPPARALLIAAFVGANEYVEALQKHGAQQNAFTAAALGDRRKIEKTLQANPVFATDRDQGGLTGLQCAAASRLPHPYKTAIAQLLLDAGANIHAPTKSWSHDIDALYLSANSRNLDVFELFLQRGANPTQALTCALWNATESFAELAVRRGAQPDQAVADNQPLLNNLIRWGRFSQAQWLLNHGASPNLPDQRGWTALHQAASRGNANMIRALRQAGADATRKNNLNETPRDLARADKIADLLKP
jgi:ankyrin repeat protein